MPRYIALLRAINVGGQKLIKMEDLRRHFAIPGFTNVVTYIQSGNVLFDTADKPSTLCSTIEARLQEALGYPIAVVVRSLADIKKAIKNCPFPVPEQEGVKLYVSFLSGKPTADAIATLEALSYPAEQIKVVGAEAYLVSSIYGKTKFPNAVVEKKLGVISTVRNWNTVNKILDL